MTVLDARTRADVEERERTIGRYLEQDRFARKTDIERQAIAAHVRVGWNAARKAEPPAIRAADLEPEENKLELGSLTVDLNTYEVLVAGKPVAVSPTQFKLVALLLRNANVVISTDRILAECSRERSEYYRHNHAQVMVSALRERLLNHIEDVELRTVRGVGYQLRLKKEN